LRTPKKWRPGPASLEIRRTIKRRRLTPTAAGKPMGVDQHKVLAPSQWAVFQLHRRVIDRDADRAGQRRRDVKRTLRATSTSKRAARPPFRFFSVSPIRHRVPNPVASRSSQTKRRPQRRPRHRHMVCATRWDSARTKPVGQPGKSLVGPAAAPRQVACGDQQQHGVDDACG
jgi:hypothetical protein